MPNARNVANRCVNLVTIGEFVRIMLSFKNNVTILIK